MSALFKGRFWRTYGSAITVGGGLLLGVPLAARALSGRRRGGVDPGSGKDPSIKSHGRKVLEAQLDKLRPWLDENQRKYLLLVARGESGFSSNARNDSKGEAAAAKEAYDRHASHFKKCQAPEIAWTFGSGGWFGLLPANPAWHLRETWACLDPVFVFDTAMGIIGALAFGRALQGYDSFEAHPDAKTLRAGWGNPGWMAKGPPAGKVDKWRKHAVEAGLGGSFLEETIKRFPNNYTQLYQALTAGMLPAPTDDDEDDDFFRTLERMQAGAAATDKVPMVVMLHSRATKPEGYADFKIGAPSRLILPEGPVKLGGGRGWFNEKGATADQAKLAAEMKWTAERLGPYLHELAGKKPTRGKPILIGFSQGAEMASVLAAMYPSWWSAVVVEAAWLPESMWAANIPPTVMLHGTNDKILPFQRTKEWADWLIARGAPVLFFPFQGMGHEPNKAATAQFKSAVLDRVVAA